MGAAGANDPVGAARRAAGVVTTWLSLPPLFRLNKNWGELGAVPAPRAERPLAVRRRDLRWSLRQRLKRADSRPSRPNPERKTSTRTGHSRRIRVSPLVIISDTCRLNLSRKSFRRKVRISHG